MEQEQTVQIVQEEIRALVQIQQLCISLGEARNENLKAKIVQSPQHVNRASSIGHPCERYLYYCRAEWEKRDPYGTSLQAIFDLGNFLESFITEEIAKAAKKLGWRWVGQQQPFVDKLANLSGHIDGGLVKFDEPNRMIPVEIKTCSPFSFEKIKTLDDLRTSTEYYLRSYYDQLQSYLFMTAQPLGVVCLLNKSTAEIRFIAVELDFAYYEEVLKKCERINKAVETKTVPDRNVDFEICPDCSFRHLCFEGGTVPLPKMDNNRLLEAIVSKNCAETVHKIYESSKEIIKEECSRSPETVFEIGDYLVKRTCSKSGVWTNRIKLKEEVVK